MCKTTCTKKERRNATTLRSGQRARAPTDAPARRLGRSGSAPHLHVEAVADDGGDGALADLLAEAQVERAEARAALGEQEEALVSHEVLAAADIERLKRRAAVRDRGERRVGEARAAALRRRGREVEV